MNYNIPIRKLFFYSKYSTSEKNRKIFEDMLEYGEIEKICVDSKVVRQKLLQAENIRITVVPTLLIIYATGDIEKYDNTLLDLWLNEVKKESIVVDERIEGTGPQSLKQKEREGYMQTRSEMMQMESREAENKNALGEKMGTGLLDLTQMDESYTPLESEQQKNVVNEELRRKAEQMQRERDQSMPIPRKG